MRLFRRPSGAVAAILIAATALMGTPAHAAESRAAVPQGISALPGGSVHTAAAARDGYCTAGDTSAVTVAVDFGSLGGGTIVRCASGLSRGATGLQALAAAGISTTGTVSDGGGFVCRLNGRPAADEIVPLPNDPGYTEQCVETPPGAASWSYWSAQDGGSWGYNTAGAGNRRVQLGGFEGWSFAAGDGDPPGVSPRLPAAPAPEPAPAPQPAPAPAPQPAPAPLPALEPAPAPAPVAPTQAAAPAAPAPGITGGSGGSGNGSGGGGGTSDDDEDGAAAAGSASSPGAADAPTTTDPAASEPPAASTEPAASEPASDPASSPPAPTPSSPTSAVSTSAPASTAPTSTSTSTVENAAAASGGSGAGWWTIGGVVLLAALAGGGLVLARRRRVED